MFPFFQPGKREQRRRQHGERKDVKIIIQVRKEAAKLKVLPISRQLPPFARHASNSKPEYSQETSFGTEGLNPLPPDLKTLFDAMLSSSAPANCRSHLRKSYFGSRTGHRCCRPSPSSANTSWKPRLWYARLFGSDLLQHLSRGCDLFLMGPTDQHPVQTGSRSGWNLSGWMSSSSSQLASHITPLLISRTGSLVWLPLRSQPAYLHLDFLEYRVVASVAGPLLSLRQVAAVVLESAHVIPSCSVWKPKISLDSPSRQAKLDDYRLSGYSKCLAVQDMSL
jgi:hypothetical protein